MGGQALLRIFLPTKCLNEETGILFGQWDATDNVCCVTGIIPCTSAKKIPPEALSEAFPTDASREIQLLGIWENVSESTTVPLCAYNHVEQHRRWFRLLKVGGNLPRCFLHGFGEPPPSPDGVGVIEQLNSVVVVLFDADKITSSPLLQSGAEAPGFSSNMQCVIKGWESSAKFMTGEVYRSSWNDSIRVRAFTPLKRTLPGSFMSVLCGALFAFVCLPCKVAATIVDNSLVTRNSVVKSVMSLPAVVTQFLHQSRSARRARNNQPLDNCALGKLRVTDLTWRRVIDIALGVALMWWLTQGGRATTLAAAMMQWADHVADQLQRLLNWMVGVPAGLKLNQELAQCLGQFFHYHVYLWKGYLKFLQPMWSDMFWYMTLSGCLGVSVQISFVQDMLSMMTLHIYCFYVYAARLYCLQVTGLTALWRLFRGKKWNPLWRRVDSFAFDVNQLIIGTLLFTILLFLLPTTGLFYVIFTALRLVVLSIQGTLYKVVSSINRTPVWLYIMRIVNPQAVADDVHFEVLPNMEGRALYLSLQLKAASLSTLYAVANPLDEDGTLEIEDYTWGDLIKKIISGELIYPWIEVKKEKQI